MRKSSEDLRQVQEQTIHRRLLLESGRIRLINKKSPKSQKETEKNHQQRRA